MTKKYVLALFLFSFASSALAQLGGTPTGVPAPIRTSQVQTSVPAADADTSTTLVGYGVIDTGMGTAVLRSFSGEDLVSEAAIPASGAAANWIMYAEQGAGVSTGVAIANPNSLDVTINLLLSDGRQTSLRIPPMGQHAAFVDEFFADFQGSFLGTLKIQANLPVAVLALRGTTNAERQFIITSIPLNSGVPDIGGTKVFPSVVDGGGYNSELILVNSASTASAGSVRFSFNVSTDLGANRIFDFSIPAGGVWRIRTMGSSGNVTSGYASLVMLDGSPMPDATAIIRLSSNGNLISETAVPAQVQITRSLMFGSFQPHSRTGVAIVNPSSQDVQITLTPFDGNGGSVAPASTWTLGALSQTSAFLDELIGGLPSGFKGSVLLDAASPVYAISMRGTTNSHGGFLMSTLPMVDLNQTPSGVHYFPHVVKGGSYQTEFLIMNTATSAPTLRLFNTDGKPAIDQIIATDDVSISPTTNQAPVVDAGADLTAAFGSIITLSGTVTDDGLPSGQLIRLWSKASGPGTVSFASPGSATTSVTVSAAGTYTLRLFGGDTVLAAVDTMVLTVTTAGDTTPPFASITAPGPGQTVSGTVTVSSTATDNVGVVGVQFLLDGANLGAEDLTAPYSVSWNTAAFQGSHTLTATARDAAGNRGTSSPVVVNIASGNQFYVSPTGTPSGTGTFSNPWDLQIALSQPAGVMPGDTIWLRGGTYKGRFTSNLQGSAIAPIVVRSFTNEWARIDGYLTTTLAANVTCTGSTCPITLTNSAGFSNNAKIQIGTEQITVAGQAGNTFTNNQRGYNGYAATLHNTGDLVWTIGTVLTVNGHDAIYRDFEILDSVPNRVNPSTAPSPNNWRSGEGIFLASGTNHHFINLIIHDAQDGIFTSAAATGTEIYGVITYNNGHVEADRGHGHGLYIQNGSPTKTIDEVISFNNFATGMQAFGRSGAADNVQFHGVMSFNNGSPATFAGNPAKLPANARETNLFVGADTGSNNIVASNNYLYNPPNTTVVYADLAIGYPGSLVGNNVTVQNNYAVGSIGFALRAFTNANVTQNTFVSRSPYGNTGGGFLLQAYNIDQPNTVTINNNQYFDNNGLAGNPPLRTTFKMTSAAIPGCLPSCTDTWGGGTIEFSATPTAYGKGWRQWTGYDSGSQYNLGLPTANVVAVRPNRYEQGRANIGIYNWQNLSSVSVDLSSSGLLNGDRFEIRDVQDYFGQPAVTGIYNSANPAVNIPMNLTSVAGPIGLGFTPAHTPAEFGTFVVKKP